MVEDAPLPPRMGAADDHLYRRRHRRALRVDRLPAAGPRARADHRGPGAALAGWRGRPIAAAGWAAATIPPSAPISAARPARFAYVAALTVAIWLHEQDRADRAARGRVGDPAGPAADRHGLGDGPAARRGAGRISAQPPRPPVHDRHRLHARRHLRLGLPRDVRLVPHVPMYWAFVIWCAASASARWSTSCAREEPAQGAARRARLEPGRPRRAARRLAPERQRDRDRQIRSEPAARLPHRRPLRPADRSHFLQRLTQKAHHAQEDPVRRGDDRRAHRQRRRAPASARAPHRRPPRSSRPASRSPSKARAPT